MPIVNFIMPMRTRIALVTPLVMTDRSQAERRLEYHKIVLESMGVTDLAVLGKLPLSGFVTPTPGLLIPRRDGIVAREATFSAAVRIKTGGGTGPRLLERIGGITDILKAKAFPQPTPPSPRRRPSSRPPTFSLSVLPISVAYWAADWVEIADDTQVILMQPNRWLVIIANRITVGSNVNIGWEMFNKPRPPKPDKPATPATPDQSVYMSGTNGTRGTDGTDGGPGPDGDHGAEIEIWTLNMVGTLDVVVRGQDGFKGGDGGDGGNGGRGAKGKDWTPNLFGLDCANGPGNGGRGGHGDTGGDGGPGGGGGNGGRFSLYAPQAVIDSYASGFYVDATEGRGREGGDPGFGGKGGIGGSHGDDRGGAFGPCSTSFGQNGQRGNDGALGQRGLKGPDGRHQSMPFSLQAIDQADILTALSQPAIETVSPQEVEEGDTVTATGKRFAQTDVITLDDVLCPTTVSSDTLLTFTVGKVPGGRRKPVQVKQADGSLSNKGSLNVLPTLDHAESNGHRSDSSPPAHFRPNTIITLKGTGFAPEAHVKVIDHYVSGADVEYVDSNTLRVKLTRPTSTPRNPDGEHVDVQVILADGLASNAISIVLATYRIVVFGDSIQWGQGLRDDLKSSAIVDRHVSSQHGDVGVYRDVLAHSGAIIGVGNRSSPSALAGEVPASHPTILQQVFSFSGDKDKIDLILLDGGINDIGVEDIVGPTATSNLTDKVRTHCYEDMKELLTRVTSEYPNAKVIVTGYYQIVSDDSDVTLLATLLVGVGIPLVGLPVSLIVGGVLTAAAKQVMVDRCRTFAERTAVEIPMAIQEINASLPNGPRVHFAQPNFGSRNAIFAPDAWIWGVEPPLSPQDDANSGGVASQRALDCAAAGNRASVYCGIASIGHPNVAGASEYARSIIALL